MPEDKVNLILIALEGIKKDIEVALHSVDDHEERLRCIEQRGGKRWEAVVGQVITLLVAGFAGWLLKTIL